MNRARKVTFRFEDNAELVRKLRACLERLEPPPEQIQIGELARRVGRKVSTVSRSLRKPGCPDFVGKQGVRRLLWIEPNPRLLAWLSENRKGERTDL